MSKPWLPIETSPQFDAQLLKLLTFADQNGGSAAASRLFDKIVQMVNMLSTLHDVGNEIELESGQKFRKLIIHKRTVLLYRVFETHIVLDAIKDGRTNWQNHPL